jgi:serine/threonine-protein kinase
VRSEHAVQILDVGVLASGLPFMVMEYVEGQSLQAKLDECGKLPLRVIIDVVGQACLGLAEAHSKQVVHRDVKPDNLLLSVRPDGSTVVKVVDFGLSKRLDSRDLKLTDPTMTLGSPEYMSPEQIVASESIDARADVWSLGVILYESATGQSPFPANTVMQLFSRVLEHEASAPSRLEPSLPPEFDAIVLRCLQRDRAMRFANAAEVFDALMDVELTDVDRGSSPREFGSSLVRRRRAGSSGSRLPVNAALPQEPERRGWSWRPWSAMGVLAVAATLPLVYWFEPGSVDSTPHVGSHLDVDSNAAASAEVSTKHSAKLGAAALPAPPAPESVSAGSLLQANTALLADGPSSRPALKESADPNPRDGDRQAEKATVGGAPTLPRTVPVSERASDEASPSHPQIKQAVRSARNARGSDQTRATTTKPKAAIDSANDSAWDIDQFGGRH